MRKKNLNILIGEAYRDAVKCSETAKADKLPNMFANTQKTHYQSTENVFRCAYLLAKLNRLYSHMSYYVQLNELNNADVGVTLHSQKSASEIIATISNEMKKKLVSSLIADNNKISVIIDESTSAANKSVLAIYIRTYFLNETDKSAGRI